MAESKPKTPVLITQNYGLVAEERQYVLYRYVTVDPTKAPGYKPKEGVPSPETRKEWRSEERFFPLNAQGLSEKIYGSALKRYGQPRLKLS